MFQILENDFNGYDVIINFAAIVHQPKVNDESLYKKVNTELPIYLAKQAKKGGVKHFVQMSTIAVYGNVSLIDESTSELPINMYEISKLAADQALLLMQDEVFKVSIVRPPMVYGGGIAPGNMLKLIQFAQKGIPLPFKGVRNERDFIHVQNLVYALNIIVENKIIGIVIPTDKKSVSTEKIIDLVKRNSSKTVRNIFIPKLIRVLIKKFVPTIHKKLFGDLKVKCNLSDDLYNPKYTLEKGIMEMIKEIEVLNLG